MKTLTEFWKKNIGTAHTVTNLPYFSNTMPCEYQVGDSGVPKRMEPHDFKKWRKAMGLSQKDAAEALGLKRRMIQYYEKGERDGEAVDIPLTVALACYALSQGVVNYRGPGKKIEFAEVEAVEVA